MHRRVKLAKRRRNAIAFRREVIDYFINLKSVSYTIEYNWKQKRMALKALGIFK